MNQPPASQTEHPEEDAQQSNLSGLLCHVAFRCPLLQSVLLSFNFALQVLISSSWFWLVHHTTRSHLKSHLVHKCHVRARLNYTILPSFSHHPSLQEMPAPHVLPWVLTEVCNAGGTGCSAQPLEASQEEQIGRMWAHPPCPEEQLGPNPFSTTDVEQKAISAQAMGKKMLGNWN